MALTSTWAARAFSVWRRTQTQQTRGVSRVFERRGALVPLTFAHLRHSSTATATSSEADSSSSSSEASDVDADAIPFASLSGKVHSSTLQALTKGPFKYTTMSAVQSRILPMLPGLVAPRTSESSDSSESPSLTSASLDLLVKARTGTGKTIGFLVPAIEARIRQLETISSTPSSLSSSDLGRAPHQRLSPETRFATDTVGTLILSPTRELASQIAIESQKLTSHLPGFTTHLFVGGMDKQKQIRDFRPRRKDVVVSTPGRLRDLIQDDRSGVAQALKGCKMLILDEADTLLDMGFRDDIEDIITYLPASTPRSPTDQGRQTFLFSATVSPAIQAIARSTLHPNHTFVNCVAVDTSEVHDHIPQYHTSLASPSHQLPHIARLLVQDQLEHGSKSKVVLFLSTTKQTMLFAQILNDLSRTAGVFPEQRIDVFELHSKRTMTARTRAAEMFRRSSRPSILVTSDVSARGVDYPGVTRVIQLGLPKSAEQYVHRVGRTGRGASKVGRGDLVLLDWEREFVRRNFTHLPLKPLTTTDFASELAQQVEANGKFQTVYAELDRTIEQYLPRIDTQMVEDSVASQAGFYASLSGPMGLTVDGVVEGLKKWAVEGLGLERPPYISAALLQKIGGGKGDRRGSARGSSRFNGGFGGDRQAARRSSERTAGVFGQKREWRDDGERRPFQRREFDGERKPFQRREFDGERKPFQRREFDGERKPFQRREFGGEGERRPFQRREFGGERTSPEAIEFDADGMRKPRFPRQEFGGERRERREFGGGERKPFPSRKGRSDFDGLFDL